MNIQIIDELLNKARSYPKVEGYLRNLDRQRIDEGKDVPVTKREKAVRQADENAALKIESQGKSTNADIEKTSRANKVAHGHIASDVADKIVRNKKDLSSDDQARIKAAKKTEYTGAVSSGGREGYFGDAEFRRVKSDKAVGVDTHKRNQGISDKLHEMRNEKSMGRPADQREMERMAGAEYRYEQNNPNDTTPPDSITTNLDKDTIMKPKSFDDQTAEYFVKCHTHVLFGEEEESLKRKKIEAPKAKGHVFGADPKDKRGSELEMVIKKESSAYKSEESDLVKSIDEIMEKAVIGYHARGGKFETGTHKDPKSHGKVSIPALSEERKKQILEGSRKKALTQAEMGGLHGQAAKIRAEKSLDERTSDLAKSLYDIVNRKKFSKIDPDSGIDKKKEQAMDQEYAVQGGTLSRSGFKPYGKDNPHPTMPENLKANKSLDPTTRMLKNDGLLKPAEKKKVPSSFFDKPEAERKRIVGERAWKNYDNKHKKSLDERTCDLNKTLTADRSKEIHDAVMTARMIKEDIPEASKMKVKPEDIVRVARTHNNIAAKRSLKSVVDTWQIESPFITKGVRVMPVGPGGQIQDLSKDEDEDSGAE